MVGKERAAAAPLFSCIYKMPPPTIPIYMGVVVSPHTFKGRSRVPAYRCV